MDGWVGEEDAGKKKVRDMPAVGGSEKKQDVNKGLFAFFAILVLS